MSTDAQLNLSVILQSSTRCFVAVFTDANNAVSEELQVSTFYGAFSVKKVLKKLTTG